MAKKDLKNAVLALGNFDGVHKGHRKVLAIGKSLALREKLPFYAVTFEPHPALYFKKDLTNFLLTPLALKTRLLKEAGADGVIVLPFDKELASMSPQDFVAAHLGQAKHVVVGFNFAFGARREGSAEVLKNALIVPAHQNAQGDVVSSSLIRPLVAKGDLESARELLGRPFMISGRVEKGQQQGRALSYPTANIKPQDSTRPPQGVYIMQARLPDGTWRNGMGITTNNLIEIHLFDFNEDLYEKVLDIAFLAFLRPLQQFDSKDQLKAQLDKDAQKARRYFK